MPHKRFDELRDKMTAESRERVNQRLAELLKEMETDASARYVRIDDDLIEAFPTAEAVNAGLRRWLKIQTDNQES